MFVIFITMVVLLYFFGYSKLRIQVENRVQILMNNRCIFFQEFLEVCVVYMIQIKMLLVYNFYVYINIKGNKRIKDICYICFYFVLKCVEVDIK